VNALLEQPVLPAGVLPLTAVRTAVEAFADGAPGAEVRYRSGATEQIPLDAVGRYATEDGNPGNRRHVAEVRIRVRAPAAAGLRLLDTPGLASPFADTAAAAEPAAGAADAACVVLAADQPASRAELDLLERTAATVPVVVVVNRLDAVDAAERERVVAFVGDEARRAARRALPVLGTSARAAMDGSPAWRARVADLRAAVRAAVARADRAARVRAALRALLATAVSQAALRHRAPDLARDARTGDAARRARDLELALLAAGARLRAEASAAADAIVRAVAAAGDEAAEGAALARAARVAATCAVRAGHEPDAAIGAALAAGARGWSAAERRALEDAVRAAESRLRAAVRDAVARELGETDATRFAAAIRLAVAPPAAHVPPLRRHHSRLPGPLGEWRVLRAVRGDIGAAVDATRAARQAAIAASVRAATDEVLRAVLDRTFPATRDDSLPIRLPDAATETLRALLAEVGEEARG
jgi:hypothetical protein